MDIVRIWYTHFTEKVAVRARTDEMLQLLVLAVIHAAADYDMYATGKSKPNNEDYRASYYYFRELVDKLGISPQAITDVIDGCFPDAPHDDLTERNAITACSG